MRLPVSVLSCFVQSRPFGEEYDEVCELIHKSPLKATNGCIVTGIFPGSHSGRSFEPASAGNPPLPSGLIIVQQLPADTVAPIVGGAHAGSPGVARGAGL